MNDKIRTSVDLTPTQNRWVTEQCSKTGRPKAEVIRNGVELMQSMSGHNYGPPPVSNSLGLTKSEIQKYDPRKILNYELARAGVIPDHNAREKAAFELECSRAEKQKAGINTPGSMIVMGVQDRGLSAGTSTSGAELVASELKPNSFIDVLRKKSVVIDQGASILTDLEGNVTIPRKTLGASAAWIETEGGNAAQSDPQFDQINITPKTLGAYTDLTRNIVLQGSPDVTAMIIGDISKSIASEIDRAALYGSGTNGEPTGIINTTGINAPTSFAAAIPTWPEIVAMETSVAVDNALHGNLGYILDSTTRAGLRISEKSSGSGVFIMTEPELLNGYKAAVTNNVTTGDVFFGNWSDLLIGMWGGLDIMVDRYTYSLSGTVRIVGQQTIGFAVRHPESFAWNNDGS